MGNIANVKIGAGKLTYKTADLGHTMDGTTFEIANETTELTVDQYGNTPVDIAKTGEHVTIKVKLAEPTTINLSRVLPGSQYLSGAAGSRVGIGTDAGYLMSQDAGLLVFHPSKNASSDDSEDIQVYNAVVVSNDAIDYKFDSQRTFGITFTALSRDIYVSGRRLAHVGNLNIS